MIIIPLYQSLVHASRTTLGDSIVEIKPLKTRYGVTKLDLIFHFLSIISIDIDLNIQTHITCIVHDLRVLRVAQKIQVMVPWKMISCSSQFMDLGNPIKIIMHYPLIRGMTYLDCQEGIPMVSAVVCMGTHSTKPMINHDVRLLSCHDLPSFSIVQTLNLEILLSLYWNQ